MEILNCTLLLITITIIFCAKFLQQKKKQLPPSPLAFPIIGHLYLLKGEFHRALENLSRKYGPVIYLRFGSRPTVVVSSPSTVEECMTKNDIVFANRAKFLLTKHLAYNHTTVGACPYGDHWRNLRRVSTIHFFSSLSVQNSSVFWTEEIRLNMQKLFSDSNIESWKEVNLTSLFEDIVKHAVMRIVCGKRWSSAADVFGTFDSLTNICDFIPMLSWIGYGGIEKKMISLQSQADKFLQDLIDEGRKIRDISCLTDKQRKTVVQVMLSLQEAEPEYYTDEIVKGMAMVVITAGTDTSIQTMQWAMSLLLNHPEVLEKARIEIRKNIGEGRLVEDSDFPKLPYLRCIINETLRLFPIVPLLLPHFSSEDCTINGYKIPADTTLMINAWAIHRDPNVWEEPTKFKPERFEGIDVGCEGFKFIPFGKGRRSCPGNTLAMRLTALTLGTLIQCFEWKRLGPGMVNLEEKCRITMHQVKPLDALYRPRLSIINFAAQTGCI